MVKLFLGYLQVMGQVVYSLVEEVVVDSNIQDRILSIHLLQVEVVVEAVEQVDQDHQQQQQEQQIPVVEVVELVQVILPEQVVQVSL